MKKSVMWYSAAVAIGLLASVAGAAENLITNGSFYSSTGWVPTGNAATGSASVVEDGSGCVRLWASVHGDDAGMWTQTVQVTPNTEYGLYWYAMPGGTGGGYYKYRITDADDNVIATVPYVWVAPPAGQWSAGPGVTFNSGDNTVIKVSFVSHSTDWVAFDNVHLFERTPAVNTITNSMCYGTPSNPSSVFGWTGTGDVNVGSGSLDKDASVNIYLWKGSNPGKWTQTVEVTPNTDCSLHWFAMPGGTGGGWYYYSITDLDDNEILKESRNASSGQYQWAKANSAVFNTGNNTAIKVSFIAGSSDWVAFDNIHLFARTTAVNTITNGKCYGTPSNPSSVFGWTGTDHVYVGSGSFANDGSVNIYLLRTGGVAGKWTQTVEVTPNTDCTLHWYAMPGGAGGGVYDYSITDLNDNVIQGGTRNVSGQYQWTKVDSGVFNTGGNTAIKVSFMGRSSDWVAFDNIKLTVASVVPFTATPTFSPKGGNYAAAQTVTISCETPGAIIRYTTDGSTPTIDSPEYENQIVVDQNTVLKAKAWGTDGTESGVAVATFNFPTAYQRPEVIGYDDDVAVDGDLNEWASANWAALDQVYYGNPSDIAEARYAAKWGAEGNKLFVAVKVQDTALHLEDEYIGSEARDAVEVYVHTTGIDPVSYGLNAFTSAQQYTVGIKSNQASVWTALGSGQSTSTANFQAAGKVVVINGKTWLQYEMAITPFEFFGGLLNPIQDNVISTLSVNDVIGLDVCVAGHNGTAFTGMKSENTMVGKWNDYTQFGLHKLVLEAPPGPAPLPGDANRDGVVNFADFSILQNNYGQSGKIFDDGDFNGDGWVTFEDFSILQNHYGQTEEAAPAAGTLAAATSGACGPLGLVLLALVTLSLLFLRYQE